VEGTVVFLYNFFKSETIERYIGNLSEIRLMQDIPI